MSAEANAEIERLREALHETIGMIISLSHECEPAFAHWPELRIEVDLTLSRARAVLEDDKQ